MHDTIERSRFLGRPVHLYEFRRQALVWRFAAADRDITITIGEDVYVYSAAQIERDEIKQTSERAKDRLNIRFAYLRNPVEPAEGYPSTQALGDNWHPYAPSDPISVRCLAHHYGDTDPPAVEWMGVATSPKFSDVELELGCEPDNGAARARNQGPKWQRSCWKTVYSTGLRGCNLDLDAFAVNAELTAVTTLTITAAEFASAPLPLDSGFVTWEREDGLIERRSIRRHDGDTLHLHYGAVGLEEGVAVTARPSCPRTWVACEARGNTLNWGGHVYKPVKNPHDGVSMSWGG